MYNSISPDNYQRLTLESWFTRPFDYRLQQLNRKKKRWNILSTSPANTNKIKDKLVLVTAYCGYSIRLQMLRHPLFPIYLGSITKNLYTNYKYQLLSAGSGLWTPSYTQLIWYHIIIKEIKLKLYLWNGGTFSPSGKQMFVLLVQD